MSAINVNFDLTRYGEINDVIRAAVDKAVERLAIQAGKNWAHAIVAADLPDKEKLDYARTLRVQRAGFAHFIVSADYAKAEQVENGRPAQDLKRMLQTSRKVRTSAAGKKYLIIPFRTNTEGSTAHARDMPHAINEIATQMERSMITGHRIDSGGVRRATYLWPKNTATSLGRLPPGLAPKLQPHHVSDPYAGMRRFDNDTHNAKTGKTKTTSSYLTFRVLHQDSRGWIIPAKPGLHIAQGVADQMQSKAEPYLEGLIASMLA